MLEITRELGTNMSMKENVLFNITTDSFMKIDKGGGVHLICYHEIIKTHNVLSTMVQA